MNVTHRGGRSSELNQQFSFGRPTVTSMTPETASLFGGDFLITGENLGNPALGIMPTGVRLGGRPCASMELVSSTQLNCTGLEVGAGYTTTTIELTVVNQAVAAPVFQYEGAPIIRSVTPAVGSVDGGEELTITGSELDGVNSVAIGGRDCAIVGIVTSGEVKCTTPPGVGSIVRLEVTKGAVKGGGTGLFGYAPPQVAGISPPSVVGGTLRTSFIVQGTHLGNRLDAPSLSVGGVSCDQVDVVNSSFVSCNNVSVSSTQGWSSDDLVLSLGGETITLLGLVARVGFPVVRVASPPVVGVDGGETIVLVGEQLAGT